MPPTWFAVRFPSLDLKQVSFTPEMDTFASFSASLIVVVIEADPLTGQLLSFAKKETL